METKAVLKMVGGLAAVFALTGLGVLALPSVAAAEGGLSLSGVASEPTADGAGRVALTIANKAEDAVRLTGLTAPAGFTCAEASQILQPGGTATLHCDGKYGELTAAPFGVTGLTGETGRTESAASTIVPLPVTATEAEGVLAVDVKADKTTVHAGDPVTYTITVKNVHPSFTILDVVVRSPDVAECERDLGDMEPGQTEEYTCVSPAPNQSFTVRIRVRGYDSGGTVIGNHDNDVVIKIVPKPSPSQSSPSPSGPPLAVTGTTATVIALSGVALLVGGTGLWLLARRRRVGEY
ncbi:LPXTG cell wall anchor domain-containing protein [Phytomonospora sp. NPDC050363]|uniref:LPXTG cell wall anchor domain-containing protein n=1 Tax=Phytomonospora sp. NPDC050363 TaxID=3155642 RepID=UPI0033D53B9A